MNKKLKEKLKKSTMAPILLKINYLFRVFMFSFFPKYSTLHFYSRKTGKTIDINNVKTYNEKIQWMKIYDHNPIYTQLSDKYKVREYVSKQIGDHLLVPLLGVWESFEQIDFNKLPNEFVIKCNHDCGSTIICNDKNNFDFISAKSKITKALNRNYYYCSGEWQYKNISRKIIVEKNISKASTQGTYDYKFFCFDGEPYMCVVDADVFTNHKEAFYDLKWNKLPLEVKEYQKLTTDLAKPNDYETMIEIARKLSKGLKQVRVDLYYVDNHIYFGELSFSCGSGAETFYPDEYDLKLGNMWHIKS